MQLINHQYETVEKLEIFADQFISHKGSVFIQLFSGVMDKQHIQPILNCLSLKLPDAVVMGTTSAGEIIDGVMTSGEIIVSVSLFNATNIKTYYYPHSDYNAGVQAAKEILSDQTKVCIAFSEGLKSDSESFLDGFSSICSDRVIAGGNAGDDLSFSHTYIMKDKSIYDEGIVIAALESDVLQVHNGYSLNWTPVGKEMTITRADNNIVYEIDGSLIKDVYIHYLGVEAVSRIPASAIEFPLVKTKEGVLVARAMIAETEDGGFVYAGHFEEGEKVRFAIGNIHEILNHAVDLQATVSSAPVEATYIYSCSVRKLFLEEQLNYEFGLINDIAPTAGFFTYGEFFHSSSGNELLNITTTTLSLSESGVAHQPFKRDNSGRYHHSMLKSLTHLINVTQDELDESIRELVAKESTIERQLRDELTGLKNRTALLGDLNDKASEVTLILLNIDSFSTINDYFGYEVGDQVLKVFAQQLEITVDHEYIYRISGDEFAVICINRPFDDALRDHLTDNINKLENFKYQIEGYEISINTSSGIANGPHLDVYNFAHMALKEAKEQRAKLIFFNDNTTLTEKTHNNIWMINKIKSAIEEDRIVPYFQGIVDNQTGRIVKYESLIRLIEPDGTVLTPFWFLDHAKKSKLYDKLTQIMIAKTFAIFENLEYEFSLNLTVHDIVSDETRSYLYRMLEESHVAKRLIFEIVESEGIVNYEEVIDFIKTVKQYGCKIAIDDFGTGYSNFNYLSKLDVDYIKIDGSLIQNINRDEDHLFTVESILFFAHKKGIKTIAEFVKDESVFNKMLELGIDYSQGYLFSVPASQILR